MVSAVREFVSRFHRTAAGSFLGILFGIMVFAAPPVWAQGQAIDGVIEGTVLSSDGQAVSGARVQALNLTTGFKREIVTESSGRFIFQILPPGRYTVSVAYDGFAKIERTNIDLNAGQIISLPISLAVAQTTDAIVVKDEAPLVEVAKTVVSNTYDERAARAIPTVGRSLLDFFVLQPGVNARPISTGGSGTGTPTTTYGGLGLRQINVDGVSNNLQGGARNLVISQESIKEFQTVTNFSAEFGRTGGGLQNAFTRSGGNEFHGSGFFFTRQKFLSSRPFLLAPNAPKPEFSRYNYGGTASGPVVKDKVFFFATYERWQQDLPGVLTITPANAAALGIPASSIGATNQTFRAHTVTAKVDWQINQDNRLSTRYNFYYDRESPLGTGLQSREVLRRFDENPQSITTQLVTALSPRLVNEARFLFSTRGITNGVAGDENAPQINISGIGNFNGNSNGTGVSRERGFQLIDNLSWTTGNHTVKFGFDILPVWFQERTTNVNGTFTFGGLPAAGTRGAVTPLQQFLFTEAGTIDPTTGRPYSYSRFTQSVGQEFTEARVVNQGYYVQDDWQVARNFKLNLGLRYELFTRPEGNLNPAFAATGRIPTDTNNFAPRVGAAWNLFGNGKTVLRGGFGVYYNTLLPQTFNTFLRENGVAVRSVDVTPTSPGAPAFTRGRVTPATGVNVVSNVRVFAEDFDNIRVMNSYVTLEQELFRDLSVAVSYLGTYGRNLPVSFNTNLAQAGTLPDGRRRWSTANRPDPRFGNILVASSVGEQNYNGLLLTVTKRFSKGFSFQTAYHYSKVTGQAFADDFTGFGIFTLPSDPLDLSVDRGLGDFDLRHRFTATGVWEPTFNVANRFASTVLNGWQVSTRIIASSGYAFNATTGQDTNGDTVFNDRPAGIARNSFALPGYATLDVRLSRFIKFGEGNRLELIVEGFNLANRLNPTGVNTVFGPGTTPNPTFRQVTAAETSRQFQLAARFSF